MSKLHQIAWIFLMTLAIKHGKSDEGREREGRLIALLDMHSLGGMFKHLHLMGGYQNFRV